MHEDAIVIGAGFAGLYALHRLRALGLRVLVLEQGSGIGGVWHWNRYPGARCDVDSLEYSYSFSDELQQEWEWSERYASQPEILRYLEHVADRFDLRRDIRLHTRVSALRYDEEANRWEVDVEGGGRHRARFCVLATGCLTAPKPPAFPGLERFAGDWYHTARWPHDGLDLRGRRVGVVGTGSTGIQAIPKIAAEAEHLFVFQRTANFSLPARNRPLDGGEQREAKSGYGELRRLHRESGSGTVLTHPSRIPRRSAVEATDHELQDTLERGWSAGGVASFTYAFRDITRNARANARAAEFVRAKIRALVHDPAVAERLLPTGHPLGSRRVCLDSGYFETFNRANVTLVDVRAAPIREITPSGVRTADSHYQLDTLVFALGFDAMTGALARIDVRGRDGAALRAHWADGPRTYLGLCVAGFPNLFIVAGPQSPSVFSNMVVSVEQHVDWIADCLAQLARSGHDRIEATPEAEAAWVDHVADVARDTLFPLADSWYMGSNIAGKPRMLMPYAGGVGAYRARCDEIARNGYPGFARSSAVSAASMRSPSGSRSGSPTIATP